ncbi:polygalacturonase [Ricinus communis]|uniref:endo-polygalacturonase n=1 Tax=Ricinus communis TaxID=3988 RepID=B9SUE7_RICCO|nr:polygalacturonase [Ricinus communis]EEF32761.1 Polygalacturonase precursor, putative [Ricinus communis]|eukprot:XP_002529616.1 polygalacturonase [Ricinus communis]
MALQKPPFNNLYSLFFLVNILSFIIVMTIPSYNCLQHHDTLNDYLQEASGYGSPHHHHHHQQEAYPSYFSSIDDGQSNNEDLILMRANVLDLNIFDKVGTTSTSAKTFSVDAFGAKADGSDDTKAFQEAWKAACSSAGSVLVVPDNNYLIKPIRFSGPCKSNLTLQIYGTIEASDDRSDYEEDDRHWIVFERVQNFLVEGGGTIDGNGKIWWQNSCKLNKDLPCKDAPTALTFYKCKNLVVENLKIQNAQQMHVSFQGSKNVKISNLIVTSPEESPNTDGIHVTSTQNIQITDCVIGTGDDCISIVSGSQNVQAMNITCGPGHGISIGSLGSGNSKAHVSGVTINGAKLSGTTNGVRIKTWQGGSGNASNIKFQNIKMDNVSNPIIIDQNYCDQDKPCKEQKSAVQVKDVVYKNIKGTSASHVAIKFDCSNSHPCEGILLQDVSLERQRGDETAIALCNNVDVAQVGVVSPHCP